MEDLKNKTKIRFVNDSNLPIQVVEEPYFSYFLDLYEPYNQARTKYGKLVQTIEEKFSSDENMFLEHYYYVRDKVIKDIQEKDSYKEFNSSDMNRFKIDPKIKLPNKTNIYNKNEDGKVFISIDLKEANFQSLKYVNPDILNNKESYKDFISDFTNLDYFKDSKYTRQIIFGQLNPSRQVTVQQYIMYELYNNYIKDVLKESHIVRSITNDEIIIECTHEYIYLTEALNGLLGFHNIKTKIELFLLNVVEGTEFFVKRNLITNINEIKCVPVNLFAQVYKKVNEMEIIENDLLFYNDKMLAKYINKI